MKTRYVKQIMMVLSLTAPANISDDMITDKNTVEKYYGVLDVME